MCQVFEHRPTPPTCVLPTTSHPHPPLVCVRIALWIVSTASGKATMVNTGKPSGACGVCRERRIKCDETKPTCLKCTRSGRTCSGYSHGLKLRDQTQKTIIKARLGKPRAKGQQRRGSVDQRVTKSPPTTPASMESGEMTTASASAATTMTTPRQQAAKARRLSLPGPGEDWPTNGEDFLANKRRKRSVAAAQQESWSFEWQVEEDALVDPLLWQTIDTPIVEQARCYFLSSK